MSIEKSYKILLAGPDAASRQILSLTLGDSSCELIEAASRSEAIHKFIQKKPQIVILDAYLDKQNGFELCRQLRQLSKDNNVPIIIVSTLSDCESTKQAYEAGATDYITKPFDIFELRSRVRFILKNRDSNIITNSKTLKHDSKTL